MHMIDWAIKYIMHVLDERDWSANRLATEAGVASSTISRPLREKDYPHDISRKTISKVFSASGIDPTPFIPKGMNEGLSIFHAAPKDTTARRALEAIDSPDAAAPATLNEIRVAVVGQTAQIAATVDREGLQRLRKKIDAIEAMLDA